MKFLAFLLLYTATAQAAYNQYSIFLTAFQGSSPTAIGGNLITPGTYDWVVFNGTPANATISCSVISSNSLNIHSNGLGNSFRFPASLTTTVHGADYWSYEYYIELNTAVAGGIIGGQGSQAAPSNFSTEASGTKARWCGATACINSTTTMSTGVCYHVAYVMSRTAGVFSRKIYFGTPPSADVLEASDTTNDPFDTGTFSVGRAPGVSTPCDCWMSDARINIYPDNSHVQTNFPSIDPPDTPTSTITPSVTPTYTITPTFTDTSTISPTWTNTSTITSTFSDTSTISPTWTNTSTITPTFTPTPTSTVTPTWTFTRTITPSDTPTVTSSATPSPTFTPTNTMVCTNFGNTDNNGNYYAGNGTIFYKKLTVSAGAQIQKIYTYIQSGQGQIKGAIYTDLNGYPRILLAQSAPVYVSTGWQNVTITSGTLAAGAYWVAMECNSSVKMLYSRVGQDKFQYSQYGPWPNPAISQNVLGNASIYSYKCQ